MQAQAPEANPPETPAAEKPEAPAPAKSPEEITLKLRPQLVLVILQAIRQAVPYNDAVSLMATINGQVKAQVPAPDKTAP